MPISPQQWRTSLTRGRTSTKNLRSKMLTRPIREEPVPKIKSLISIGLMVILVMSNMTGTKMNPKQQITQTHRSSWTETSGRTQQEDPVKEPSAGSSSILLVRGGIELNPGRNTQLKSSRPIEKDQSDLDQPATSNQSN